MTKKIAKTIERLGWAITEEGDGFYLSQYSPAGEDFGFSVRKGREIEDIREFYNAFDIDEHVEMWIAAKSSGVSGVPCASVLVHDAEEIESMLEELAIAVCANCAEFAENGVLQ